MWSDHRELYIPLKFDTVPAYSARYLATWTVSMKRCGRIAPEGWSSSDSEGELDKENGPPHKKRPCQTVLARLGALRLSALGA